MDAIALKHQIEIKLDSIAETIAFSYGKKYEEIIHKKIKNLMFYVYDNEDYQIDRLENIDLIEVAKEFAKDLTYDLYLDDEKKEELENKLAVLIGGAQDIGISDGYIRKIIKDNPPLNQDIDKSIRLVEDAMYNYNNDYRVKEIRDTIVNARYKIKSFETSLDENKEKVLKSILHLHLIDSENVSYIWDLLEAFNPANKELFADEFYKDLFRGQQEEFYELIGLEADGLEELEKLAQENNLLIDDQKYYTLKKEYAKACNDLVKQYYSSTSNLLDIIDDLQTRGYHFDKDAITTFLVSTKRIFGVNFPCIDKNGDETSFIIYNNDAMAYSCEFSETCIHEMIHGLGGANCEISKKGLHYNNDVRFIHLEEAYTTFLAKKISDEYVDKYGNIVDVKVSDEIISKYDRALQYFDVVFNKYGEQLKRIHLSEDIDYKQALSMCPIIDIANSLTLIMDASRGDVEKVTNQEIEKITRGTKR